MEPVSNEAFIKAMRFEFEECMKIMEKKIKDYNPDGFAFADVIKDAEVMWPDDPIGQAVSKYIYVFLNKHYKAIKRYALEGKSESEPIAGRFYDACNFLIIMKVLIQISEPDFSCKEVE